MTNRLTDEQIDWLLGLVGSATLRVMCGDRMQYSTDDLAKAIRQLREERNRYLDIIAKAYGDDEPSALRNAALEEAAKVADGFDSTKPHTTRMSRPRDIAAAIRELKDE